jgi:prophage antirepressor-like protein
MVPFSFDGSEIRVTEGPDGKPWYCAKDVCNILGYANSRDAVEQHCRDKGVAKCYTLTSGGPQEALFISEPNLYRLICRSTLPAAAKFEAWVYEVLIPAAVRAAGAVPPVAGSAPADRYVDKYILLLEDNHSTAKTEIARLHSEIRALKAAMPCSEEEVDTFMLLRNMGYSIRRISRATKRSRSAIRRHLRDDNLPDIDKQIEEMTE